MSGRFKVETIFSAVDKLTKPVLKMERSTKRMLNTTTRGLAKANARLNRFIKGVGGAARKMALFGASLVAAAGVTAVLTLKRLADGADELAKRSRRLDFPIEDLQKYQFIAEQSGFTTDGFSSALDKLGRTLGEAKVGTGALFTFLQKNDKTLLAQIKNSKSVAGGYELILKKIRATEDPTIKLALAAAAFGRAGQGIVNIAEQSDEALAALSKEMEENGLLSKQAAQDAEAFNDATASLKLSLVGMLRGAIFPLLPAITDYVKILRSTVVAKKDIIRQRVAEYFERLKVVFKETKAAVIDFLKTYDVKKTLGDAVDIVIKSIKFFVKHGDTMGKLAVTVGILIVAFKALSLIMVIVAAVTLASPLGLIVLAVGAIGVAVAAAVVWWDELKAAFDATPAWLKLVGAAFLIVSGPIGALAVLAGTVFSKWEPIKAFFLDLGETIERIFTRITSFEFPNLNPFSNTPDDPRLGQTPRQTRRLQRGPARGRTRPSTIPTEAAVASPAQQARQAFTGSQNASRVDRAEIKIVDETGRAQVDRGKLPDGLTLVQSGGF